MRTIQRTLEDDLVAAVDTGKCPVVECSSEGLYGGQYKVCREVCNLQEEV